MEIHLGVRFLFTKISRSSFLGKKVKKKYRHCDIIRGLEGVRKREIKIISKINPGIWLTVYHISKN